MVRYGMLLLLLPFTYAVGISTDVGVKVNVSSKHWLRIKPIWVRVLLAVSIIAAYALYYGESLLLLAYTHRLFPHHWVQVASYCLVSTITYFVMVHELAFPET